MIKIKEDLELLNPTMEVKGIFDALDENGNFDFKYLEIHFKGENIKGIHSRYWIIEEGVTAEDFINNHEILKTI
jgi:hypothetical protein